MALPVLLKLRAMALPVLLTLRAILFLSNPSLVQNALFAFCLFSLRILDEIRPQNLSRGTAASHTGSRFCARSMGGNKNTKAAADADRSQLSIFSFVTVQQRAGGTPGTQPRKRAQPDSTQQSSSAPDKQLRPTPNLDQQRADVTRALTNRRDELFTGNNHSMRYKNSGPSVSWQEVLDAIQNCSVEQIGALHAALCQAK